MVLTDWSYYRANPGEIFSFSTLMAGGVFYGGFLAALFFTVWYVRVQKLSFWKLADVLAPGVALGQSVGRLGCFQRRLRLRQTHHRAVGSGLYQHLCA